MISAKALLRGYKADAERCLRELREGLRRGRTGETGGLGTLDFSLRDLAEASMGHQMVSDALDPRKPSGKRQLREAEEAVDSTGFSNITGQLIINSVMQAFQSEAFVASRLTPTVPTRLDGEKIPGIGKLSDPESDNADNLTVKEGMPYPHAGVSEDYIETPSTTKRGLIVPVTKEAIFFDRTGLLVRRCSEVGEILGLSKEKRCLDAWGGFTSGAARYKWKGTNYDTYYASGGSWTNKLGSNELEDWTDVEAAENLFVNLLDPNTGEPVNVGTNGMLLFTPPQLRHTARRIVTASELRETTNTNTVTVSPNPLSGFGIRTEFSRLFYRRMIANSVSAANAAKRWLYGDPAKAFAYMENWPITVTQSGMDSETAFNQDIILRYKASERGVVAIMEPRAMVLCTGAE